MAGATMMIGAHCAGGVPTAALKFCNGKARMQPICKKLAQFQWTQRQRGAAISKRVLGTTPKTALLTPSPTLTSGFSSRLCPQAVAQVEGQAMNEVISPRKVIVIDNYDSFTYNLCQYLGDWSCDYEVFRNDKITIKELKEKKPWGILVSPGPGAPKDSGISLEVISLLGSVVPIFGVCMGL